MMNKLSSILLVLAIACLNGCNGESAGYKEAGTKINIYVYFNEATETPPTFLYLEDIYNEEGEVIAMKLHRVEMEQVEFSPTTSYRTTTPIQFDEIGYGGWLDTGSMPTAAKVVENEQDGAFVSSEKITIGSYWDEEFGGIPLWDAAE